ncbi:MAG: class B sortase [Firmicutes bacterium]|nr:class B sortase [Bacillota bacterium]
MKKSKKKKSSTHQKINTFFIIILSGVFLFSVYKIAMIQWGYMEAERLYLAAAENYVSPATDNQDSLTVDLSALKAINPEVVGWLLVDGTEISYPVVQGPDNDKYLKTAYDGTKSNAGSIFMNANNDPALTNDHTLIYGHNMRDDSMFGHLLDFEDPAYLSQHRYFTVYNEYGEHKYEIFSAFLTFSASFVYTDRFEFSWEYYDFIEKAKASSILDMGVEVTDIDRIVTLSTCTSRGNRAERFVVMGKLIQ